MHCRTLDIATTSLPFCHSFVRRDFSSHWLSCVCSRAAPVHASRCAGSAAVCCGCLPQGSSHAATKQWNRKACRRDWCRFCGALSCSVPTGPKQRQCQCHCTGRGPAGRRTRPHGYGASEVVSTSCRHLRFYALHRPITRGTLHKVSAACLLPAYCGRGGIQECRRTAALWRLVR